MSRRDSYSCIRFDQTRRKSAGFLKVYYQSPEAVQHEALILQIARVNCLNIPTLIYSYLSGEYSYMIFEFIEGQTLSFNINTLRESNTVLEEGMLFKLTVNILETLSELHQNQVEHHNLNASKFIINHDLKVTVVGFKRASAGQI